MPLVLSPCYVGPANSTIPRPTKPASLDAKTLTKKHGNQHATRPSQLALAGRVCGKGTGGPLGEL
jgi:hypothetical protein